MKNNNTNDTALRPFGIKRALSNCRTFVTVIILCSVFNCSKNTVFDQKYEGFKNNKLRVYVTQSTLITSESKPGMPVEKGLLSQARERAAYILQNHIKTQYTGVDTGPFLKLLPAIFETAQMIMQNCTDTECTAFVDYNIESFIELEKKLPITNE